MYLGIGDSITACCTLAFWSKGLNFNSVCQSQGVWIGSEAAAHILITFFSNLFIHFHYATAGSELVSTIFGKTPTFCVQCIRVAYNTHAAFCTNNWNWINMKWFNAFDNRTLHSESHFQSSVSSSCQWKNYNNFPAYLRGSALALCTTENWSLHSRQRASANSGLVCRGRYLIVSFCPSPRDDSCQSLKDGVKFRESLWLHGKFSSGNSSFYVALAPWWWYFQKGMCNFSLAMVPCSFHLNFTLGFLIIVLWIRVFSLLWMFTGCRTAAKAEIHRFYFNKILIEKEHEHYYFSSLTFFSISTIFFFLTQNPFKVPCGYIYDMRQNKKIWLCIL